ncbi:hypothetical protein [Mesorhizobium huakuii]|uniref:Uncharacterized protein n=1 Tax=Mesorhizobium huakuii TaxID=28104 RepID=A0A7G6T1F6_9HYPH|nr:hypothetical protein [Mesorhizobium huakuii]QND60588.1 hypothetical protein HB778_31750 [Mesorhizobium huakuii]
MNAQTNYKPIAKGLVEPTMLHDPVGSAVSVKETVAAVRKEAPHLEETDCDLVEIIVDLATVYGMAVLFDLKNP